MENPIFTPAGDNAFFVSFGDEISDLHQTQVQALFEALKNRENIISVQPSYSALTVTFDLARTTHEEVTKSVLKLVSHATPKMNVRRIVVPVMYGGEFGPDLEDVALETHMSPEQVIALHTQCVYKVNFLGFMPGFPYLSGLPVELKVSRLATPRTKVPAGSIGLAGSQTGIYPLETPGGWRIIGRTPLKLFDPEKSEPSLLKIGDEIQFQKISAHEFKSGLK